MAAAKIALVEACEYRENFLHLRPKVAAILNIDPDHFDCFPTSDDLTVGVRTLCPQCAGRWQADRLPDACSRAQRNRQRLRPTSRNIRLIARRRLARGEFGTLPRPLPLRFRAPRSPVNAGQPRRFRAGTMCSTPWRQRRWRGIAAYRSSKSRRALASFRGLQPATASTGPLGRSDLDRRLRPPPHGGDRPRWQRCGKCFPRRRSGCVFQPHQASRLTVLLDELAASLHNADKIAVAEVFRAREGAQFAGRSHGGRLGRTHCGPPAPTCSTNTTRRQSPDN